MTSSPLLPTALVTERDFRCANMLLDQLKDGDDRVILEILTDEEIAALDGPTSLELVGSPFLDQEGFDQRSCISSALRSLAARGMVTADPAAREDEGDVLDGEGDPVERSFQLNPPLAGIFFLRRTALGFLTARRVLEGGTTTTALFLLPDDTVLEEFVTTDGMHMLSLLRLNTASEQLAAYCDPFDAAADDEDPSLIARSSIVEGFRLPDTRAATTVTAMSPAGGRIAYVYATGSNVQVIDAGSFDETGSDEAEELEIAAVSRDSLVALIRALIPEIES